MPVMSIEEFKAVEELKITDTVWVAGELKKKGDVVKLSGNDKVQLLASGKAVKVVKEKDDKQK